MSALSSGVSSDRTGGVRAKGIAISYRTRKAIQSQVAEIIQKSPGVLSAIQGQYFRDVLQKAFEVLEVTGQHIGVDEPSPVSANAEQPKPGTSAQESANT